MTPLEATAAAEAFAIAPSGGAAGGATARHAVVPLPPALVVAVIPTTVLGTLAHLGCPFRAGTGLDCPACGATRAFLSLLHGDLGAAVDHNLAAVVGGVLVVPYLILAVLRVRIPPAVHRSWLVRHRLPIFIVLIVGWWAGRNLPTFAWFGSGLSH